MVRQAAGRLSSSGVLALLEKSERWPLRWKDVVDSMIQALLSSEEDDAAAGITALTERVDRLSETQLDGLRQVVDTRFSTNRQVMGIITSSDDSLHKLLSREATKKFIDSITAEELGGGE